MFVLIRNLINKKTFLIKPLKIKNMSDELELSNLKLKTNGKFHLDTSFESTFPEKAPSFKIKPVKKTTKQFISCSKV